MAKNTEIVIRALEGFTKELLQKLTLNIDANLKEDTPVDTGWARSNWVPSIGEPFRGLAGSKTGDTALIDNSVSEIGKARVLTYTLDAGAIYISNNVPYIQALNNGHSGQAPRAYVQAAVERSVREIK